MISFIRNILKKNREIFFKLYFMVNTRVISKSGKQLISVKSKDI